MTESLGRSVVFAVRKGSTTLSCLAFFVAVALATPQQIQSKQDQPQAKSGGDAQAKASTKGIRVTDLRGDYDWHRSNNDLLYYHLDIRVDPKEQSFGGKNTIKFRMLKNDCRIHLDLDRRLAIDKILFGATPLKYEAPTPEPSSSNSPKSSGKAKSTPSTSTIPPRPPPAAAPAVCPSARTRRAGPGSRPPAKARSQHLVAQQGSVAGRGPIDGSIGHDSQRSR